MVLLVEDDNTIREMMSEILTSQGYQILQAKNGKEALDTLKALINGKEPCVILLDLKMPVMDGMEFIEEIQKNSQLKSMKIPIIITSALSEARKEKIPLVSKTLMKPYDLDDVINTIDEYCA